MKFAKSSGENICSKEFWTEVSQKFTYLASNFFTLFLLLKNFLLDDELDVYKYFWYEFEAVRQKFLRWFVTFLFDLLRLIYYAEQTGQKLHPKVLRR